VDCFHNNGVKLEKMKFFKKTDLIIIISILVVSLITWITYNYIFSEKSAKAEIYYYSELVETVDLGSGIDKTFTIPQDEHVILHLYKDGSIRFEESDCPDKVCINAGKLNTVGQFAACLPNGVVVKIIPADNYSEDDLDIIAD